MIRNCGYADKYIYLKIVKEEKDFGKKFCVWSCVYDMRIESTVLVEKYFESKTLSECETFVADNDVNRLCEEYDEQGRDVPEEPQSLCKCIASHIYRAVMQGRTRAYMDVSDTMKLMPSPSYSLMLNFYGI